MTKKNMTLFGKILFAFNNFLYMDFKYFYT